MNYGKLSVHPASVALPLGSLLASWEEVATRAHQARISNQTLGPVTRLKSVDEILGGWLNPGIHVLHGEPGAGKTAFALQVASSCGCPALYVSCEMSALVLFQRVTAQATGTKLSLLNSGELPPAELMKLAEEAAAHCPLLSILDATVSPVAAERLIATAEEVRGKHDHLLIVLDSIHSWADAWSGSVEYDRLNAALTCLRGTAAKLRCAVIVVAERNRASQSAGGLSAGAGTRKLEYGAETVIGLDRDKSSPPVGMGRLGVLLSVEKNRHGAAGAKVALEFSGPFQRFSASAKRRQVTRSS